MEELLKIAKENYPVGTVFKSAFNPSRKGKVTQLDFFEERGNIFSEEVDEYAEEYIREAIYYNGIWAEIISKPEVKDNSFKLEELQPEESVKKGGEMFEESRKDNINPSHYKNGKVECIDALESATINKTGLEAVCTANVIKYLWRYEDKNGLEDIKKAQWYLNKLISHVESKSN